MIRLGRRVTWRALSLAVGAVILVGWTVLLWIGIHEPLTWTKDVWAGGFVPGSDRIILAPFPAFATLNVFDVDVHSHGTHLFIFGSDPGGRDLLALTARAAPLSLELVGLVVAARFLVGVCLGFAIGFGSRLARDLGNALGSVVIGFPYLALAIVAIQAVTPKGRIVAFAVGMTLIGWRDIAELVAERIEHVRSQPFSMAAAALGTGPLRFFQLHVVPFLRPALGVELPFQVSAVLVLLAELGYLQIFVGQPVQLENYGGPSTVLLSQPEWGQLLAGARDYIQANQIGPVLVPALAIFALALAFELVGSAVRGRTRLSS
jgi:ABC-type dipeptide/oligopeptide/nickel transport system permease subunit